MNDSSPERAREHGQAISKDKLTERRERTPNPYILFLVTAYSIKTRLIYFFKLYIYVQLSTTTFVALFELLVLSVK